MILIKSEADRITIKGHANYANGDDIVCASVSSIMYTSLNALMRFDEKCIDFKDDGSIVTIDILKHDHITDTLILNMLSLYHELASDYPKNIKFESEE